MKKSSASLDTADAIKSVVRDCVSLSAEKAAVFFKTGPGHYAEGDKFIGVSVPNLRKIAKKFSHIGFKDLQVLISSTINEERLLALLILITQYELGDERNQEKIYQFYLKNLSYVNNWNLVDASAHLILGAYLWDKDRSLLNALSKSDVLWERRVSIVSTLYFIRKNDLSWTFKLAENLLNDSHDLIHKAVGWMLREAGKRNQSELIRFLDHNAVRMPRVMLRYSIEKFSDENRKKYMSMKGENSYSYITVNPKSIEKF